MSAQIIRDHDFPSPCTRCGGVLDQDVRFCPHCGTDRPFDPLAHPRPRASLRALGPASSEQPEAARLPAAVEPAPDRPRVKPDYQEPSRFRPTNRWSLTKGMLLGWLIVAIGYAAWLLLGEGHKSVRTVDAQSAPAPDTSPAHPAAPLLAGGPPAPAGVPPAAAKPATAAANGRQADDALHRAEQCAALRDWACVQQQASVALAIDSGSQRAKSLMERAILATAWKPLSPIGSTNGAAPAGAAPVAMAAVPLPRGSGTARLPSSDDWAASAPAASKDRRASAWRASAPPLPPSINATVATSTPANTDAADVSAAAAADLGQAATNPPDSGDGSDAQVHAILQSGWEHTAPADATH